MAVKHRIVSASTGKTVKTASNTKGERGSALPLRIGAAALWIFAIVLEVLALCAMTEKIVIPFLVKLSPLVQGIVLLVIDFIAVVAGAQFWKKANRIAPASEANALKFWLWNNMGVIVCAAAFVPFIVLLLLNNDTDKRTKAVGKLRFRSRVGGILRAGGGYAASVLDAARQTLSHARRLSGFESNRRTYCGKRAGSDRCGQRNDV